MAYIPTERLTGQALSDVSATQQHVLGTKISAIDPANAAPDGEFVYVKGMAGVAQGSVVTIGSDGAISALATARSKGRIGVAMGAIVANTYGWVQTRGRAVAKATASANAAPAYFTATAGSVSNVAVAGDLVISAVFKGALNDPGAGLAYLDIDNARGGDFDNA